mgnify:CR=1 FL=1
MVHKNCERKEYSEKKIRTNECYEYYLAIRELASVVNQGVAVVGVAVGAQVRLLDTSTVNLYIEY